ncbi:nuclear transport factor 2 family protein [Thalassotalea sp. PS06]|uniref:nuclear transport factor 2 family protein n=1 Tax=Thalassotalea sp. PS06 TaxID=2594005 RepID=UPI00116580BE|nr:nuclear transport factor 2 family protein [Thalassotalea sp. PS06]QDP00998.1 nuclear transport factor 2 family protein [Thalassotalea sp. PS06]
MLTALINTFCRGDIAVFTDNLLHSSAWQQHNKNHYGEDQLRSVPQHWLSIAGRCELKQTKMIHQDQFMAIDLTFIQPVTNKDIHYTFWLETNNKVIKSASATIDTLALADASGIDEASLIKQLPTPDPLIIADYDQQDHLQSELVKPSSICNADSSTSQLLDLWWSVWAKSELHTIQQVYDENAKIKLPTIESEVNGDGLFDFVLAKFNHLTRVFVQLEHVIVEQNKAAVKWYLDGDDAGQRIRVPMTTLLNFHHGKVNEELTTTDVLAFQKRFPASTLFDR